MAEVVGDGGTGIRRRAAEEAKRAREHAASEAAAAYAREHTPAKIAERAARDAEIRKYRQIEEEVKAKYRFSGVKCPDEEAIKIKASLEQYSTEQLKELNDAFGKIKRDIAPTKEEVAANKAAGQENFKFSQEHYLEFLKAAVHGPEVNGKYANASYAQIGIGVYCLKDRLNEVAETNRQLAENPGTKLDDKEIKSRDAITSNVALFNQMTTDILAKRGVSVNKTVSPVDLFPVIEKNDLAQIKTLLATPEGKAALKTLDENGWTPLNIAADDGKKEIVSAILATKEGRDMLSTTNSANFTPLNTATMKGHKEVVDAILATPEGKATLATPDKIGYTPLNTAALNGHTEIAKAILATPEGRSTLAITGTHDYTPLNTAALKGHTEIVEAILATSEGKATITTKDTEGHTPINTAALNGHKETVDTILAMPEGRATLSIPDNDGFTALNSAAANGHKEIVEAILKTDEGKSTLNTPSNNKLTTPLISALYYGKTEVADILSKTEGVKITDEDIAVNKAYVQAHPRTDAEKDEAFIKDLESKKAELDKSKTASLPPKANEADIKSAFAEIQKATKDLTDRNVRGNNDPAAIQQYLGAASKLGGKEIKMAEGVELNNKTFLDSGFSNNVAQLQAKIGKEGKVTKEEIEQTVAIAEEIAANKGGILKTSGDTHIAKSDAVDPKLLAYDTSKLQIAL